MKKFGAFAIGGIVGAAAALLAAPRPGDETRAIVTDWATNALGEKGGNITERYQVRRDQITHDAGIIADQAGVIASDVAAKAKETVGAVKTQVQAPQFGKQAEPDTDAELRARIEEARARIANQVAANAANARQAVGGTIPSVQDAAKDVVERVQEAAETVKDAVKDADEVRADVVEEGKKIDE